MNIASAFLMGTKIKEIDVPDESWTKMTTLPNTSGEAVQKSGIAYNGSIYMTYGSVNVPRYETVNFTVYKFNGKTWSEVVTLTSGSSEYTNWQFNKGSMLFFTYAGKLYMTHAHFGDYGLGGPKMGWVFDGSTWQTWNVPVSNLSQVIEKNGKLYLFETGRRGAWNVSYWWNVYEYNDSDGSATLVAQNVCDYIIGGLQDGVRRLHWYENKIHVIDGQYHHVIEDDWTYSSLSRPNNDPTSSIVYKNKLHAFSKGGAWPPFDWNHIVYNSVSDTWQEAENIPYPNSIVGYNGYSNTFPILYKNKLWLLGGEQTNAYNSAFDDIYRYNK